MTSAMRIPSQIKAFILTLGFASSLHCTTELETYPQTPQRQTTFIDQTPGQIVGQQQADILTKERFSAVLGKDVINAWGVNWDVFLDQILPFDHPTKSGQLSLIYRKMISLLRQRYDAEFIQLFGELSTIRAQRENVYMDCLDQIALRYFKDLYPHAVKIEALEKQGGVELGCRIKITFP